jgi:hypothetical protein
MLFVNIPDARDQYRSASSHGKAILSLRLTARIQIEALILKLLSDLQPKVNARHSVPKGRHTSSRKAQGKTRSPTRAKLLAT